MRERQEDFETPSAETTDTSTERRPDAISLSYLVRFAPGPIALTDPTLGLLARSWKARVNNDTGQVLIAGATEANDGWDEETVVFEYEPADNQIVEMAFAFNQNGDPNFVCEREDGSIWVRYFQVGVGSIFVGKGTGRTPVAILDDPTRPQASEVLAWYIEGGTLRYRSQLSNYNTEVDTGFALADNEYLEGAIRTKTRRIELAYSVRDVEAGTWELRWLTSQIYPHEYEDELTASMIGVDGLLRDLIIAYRAETDELEAAMTPADAVLADITYDTGIIESIDYGFEIVAAERVSLVIEHEPDMEPLYARLTPQAAVILENVTIHDATLIPDDLYARLTPQAAVLT